MWLANQIWCLKVSNSPVSLLDLPPKIPGLAEHYFLWTQNNLGRHFLLWGFLYFFSRRDKALKSVKTMTGYRDNEEKLPFECPQYLRELWKMCQKYQWSLSFSSNSNDSEWHKPGLVQEALHHSLGMTSKSILVKL